MKLDTFINKNSFKFFAVFFLFALVAFWPRYFSKVLDQSDIRFHLHGIAMTLWCLLLIVQPYLIRTNRRNIHRALGKVSYGLVPIIIITTVGLLHFRKQGVLDAKEIDMYELALVLNAVVAFVWIYSLAMYHRHVPLVHARYMICTVFPLITPVTDRLIHIHYRPLLQIVPVLGTEPLVPIIGFVMADLMLLGLIWWDWRSTKRLDIFPIVLAIMVGYHVSVLTFYHFGFWKVFGDWFLALPLS